MKILLATKNPNKVKEMNRIFSDTDIVFAGIDTLKETPEVTEDGSTYQENAFKKAKIYSEFSSMPTLAEDSGLEVDYLGGAPGIFAARFSGENATQEENNRKLLESLKGIPFEKRTARFVSLLCLILDNESYFFEGEVRGHISESPKGDSGFGYDPVFVPDGYDKTFAELGSDLKNEISHRARAMKRLKEFLTRKK